MLRLGGPVFGTDLDPVKWVEEHHRWGYSAAYDPPVKDDRDLPVFVKAAEEADLCIAEVGVWNNPLSPYDEERRHAIQVCQEKLALADRLGALCCVNISGSRGLRWDGPHANNLTEDTYDLIIESVRAIIDAVKPKRTFYALETMPWMYPDSLESYAYLVAAIDRPAFAVHFDPVNLICSPQRYYGNAKLIHEFISQLGEHIKSVHAKDIRLQENLTTHLDEVIPGKGELNYRVLLEELDNLGRDIPVMLEHLKTAEEYRQAAEYIRSTALDLGIHFKAIASTLA
jgi:sugar phosphate isomerase/epimerase